MTRAAVLSKQKVAGAMQSKLRTLGIPRQSCNPGPL